MIVTGGQTTSRMCRRHFWYYSGNKNNNNYKKNLNPSRLMMSGSECLRVLDEVLISRHTMVSFTARSWTQWINSGY